jgi:chaperone BCS1
MDEEHLSTLFADLPKQCVVLLEDIDTAGLTHTRDTTDADNKPLTTTLPGNTPVTSLQPPTRPGKISLSALLNILDGVASQEGRVLIMTTNHIDKLDEALIRPGRVDMMVKFDLASTEMLSTIFRAIFATLEGDIPDIPGSDIVIRSPNSLSKSKQQIFDEKLREEEERRLREEFLAKKKKDEEKVDKLAEEFSMKIPSMTFSPAEIQGYLLKYKREPELAVKFAEEWVGDMKKQKVKQAEKERMEEEERVKAEKEAAEKAAKEKAEADAKEKEKSESGESKEKSGENNEEEKVVTNGVKPKKEGDDEESDD